MLCSNLEGEKNTNASARRRFVQKKILGSLNDFAALQAACANADALAGTVHDCANRLQVHVPAAAGDVMSVADVVSE